MRPVPVWSGSQFWIGSEEVFSYVIYGGNGGFVSEIKEKKVLQEMKQDESITVVLQIKERR